MINNFSSNQQWTSWCSGGICSWNSAIYCLEQCSANSSHAGEVVVPRILVDRRLRIGFARFMWTRNLGTVLLVSASCIACKGDDLPPFEDEFSGTGDVEPDGPGPHGPSCDENWFAFDGPPVEQQGGLPEFMPLAESPSAERLIEFSGPPPTIVPELTVPESNTEPPSLEPLSWEAFVAKFARPAKGGWFVEEDLFRTPEQLYEDYLGTAHGPSTQTVPSTPTRSSDSKRTMSTTFGAAHAGSLSRGAWVGCDPAPTIPTMRHYTPNAMTASSARWKNRPGPGSALLM